MRRYGLERQATPVITHFLQHFTALKSSQSPNEAVWWLGITGKNIHQIRHLVIITFQVYYLKSVTFGFLIFIMDMIYQTHGFLK